MLIWHTAGLLVPPGSKSPRCCKDKFSCWDLCCVSMHACCRFHYCKAVKPSFWCSASVSGIQSRGKVEILAILFYNDVNVLMHLFALVSKRLKDQQPAVGGFSSPSRVGNKISLFIDCPFTLGWPWLYGQIPTVLKFLRSPMVIYGLSVILAKPDAVWNFHAIYIDEKNDLIFMKHLLQNRNGKHVSSLGLCIDCGLT